MGSVAVPGSLSRENHPPVNDGTLPLRASPTAGPVADFRHHGARRRRPASAVGGGIGVGTGGVMAVTSPLQHTLGRPHNDPTGTSGVSPQTQKPNIYVIEKTTGLARQLSLAEAQTLYRGGDLGERLSWGPFSS